MSFLHRWWVKPAPAWHSGRVRRPVDLQQLEFDDHARVLVRLSEHMPGLGHSDDPADPYFVCTCGRHPYVGHMVSVLVDLLRRARHESLEQLLVRMDDPDVVDAFGRDQVDTAVRVVRALVRRPS